jgi:hypothetical protein
MSEAIPAPSSGCAAYADLVTALLDHRRMIALDVR